MLRTLTLLCVAATTLLAVGCSADEPADPGPGAGSAAAGTPSADADPVTVRSGLVTLWTGDDDSAADVATGECFADALLDRTDDDALLDAGVIDADGAVVDAIPELDADLAAVWVDAQFACVDYVEESSRALLAQSKGSIDDGRYAACLRDALTDEELRAAVAQTLSGGFASAEVKTLSRAQGRCAEAAQPG